MIAGVRSIRLRPCVIAFASGAAYEALSVVWVHRATQGTAAQTALVSGLQALAQALGIVEAVRGRWAVVFLVAGYAAGAYVAMRLA